MVKRQATCYARARALYATSKDAKGARKPEWTNKERASPCVSNAKGSHARAYAVKAAPKLACATIAGEKFAQPADRIVLDVEGSAV